MMSFFPIKITGWDPAFVVEFVISDCDIPYFLFQALIHLS